jgi:hypothetical protein
MRERTLQILATIILVGVCAILGGVALYYDAFFFPPPGLR